MIGIFIAIAMIGLIIFGAIFLIKDLDKKNQKELEEARQIKFEDCRKAAWDSYTSSWESSCVANDEKKDCKLSLGVSNSLKEMREKAESNCVYMYNR